MKKTIKLTGIITFVAVMAFTTAACGDGGGGSGGSGGSITTPKSSSYEWEDAAGNYYELVITENRAVTGGNYVLTVTFTDGTKKTSSGTASGTASSITLTASDKSSVTISISGSGELTVTSSGKILEGITISGGTVEITDGASPGETISVEKGLKVVYSDKYILNIAEAKAQTNFSYFWDWDYNTQKSVMKHLNNYMNAASVEIKNGNLNINLGIPKSRYMEKVTDYFIGDSIPSGITISDLTAKIWGEDINFYTSNGEYALFCMKDEENVAFLFYSDKAVTISGTYTETLMVHYDYDTNGYYYSSMDDGMDTLNSTVTYNNLIVKKGWNYTIFSSTRVVNKGAATINITHTCSASDALPSGYNWYVIDADYF